MKILDTYLKNKVIQRANCGQCSRFSPIYKIHETISKKEVEYGTCSLIGSVIIDSELPAGKFEKCVYQNKIKERKNAEGEDNESK